MFSASDVKELREKTGAGMLDCKKALQESEGKYGSVVFYNRDIPVYTAEESAYKYYLFDRWDKSGYIDGDKTINAVYIAHQVIIILLLMNIKTT